MNKSQFSICGILRLLIYFYTLMTSKCYTVHTYTIASMYSHKKKLDLCPLNVLSLRIGYENRGIPTCKTITRSNLNL